MTSSPDQIQIAKYSAFQDGKLDAVLAAVVALLRVSEDSPELSAAVLQALADAYPREGPRSEIPDLVEGFEATRDHLLTTLRLM